MTSLFNTMFLKKLPQRMSGLRLSLNEAISDASTHHPLLGALKLGQPFRGIQVVYLGSSSSIATRPHTQAYWQRQVHDLGGGSSLQARAIAKRAVRGKLCLATLPELGGSPSTSTLTHMIYYRPFSLLQCQLHKDMCLVFFQTPFKNPGRHLMFVNLIN